MNFLDNARVVAILAVITLHVSGEFLPYNDIIDSDWWFRHFFESATRWCVPVFVMISGALLLDPNKQESTNVFYKKRLNRIGVPLVFWSVFFLSWTALRQWSSWGYVDVSLLLDNLLSGEPYYHLWYLYMLVFLYLFTPLLRMIVKRCKRQQLVLITLILFVLVALNTFIDAFFVSHTDVFVFWFLSFVPYFMAGYLIRTDDNQYRLSLLFAVFLGSITITVLACFIGLYFFEMDVGQYIYRYLSVTMIPMSLSILYLFKSIDGVLISKAMNKKIASLVFAIYLVHPFYIDILFALSEQYGVSVSLELILVSILAVLMASLLTAFVFSRVPLLKRTI